MPSFHTLLLSAVVGLTGPAHAADPVASAARCLEDFDLACASDAVNRVSAGQERRILDVRVAFHQGRYDDAMAGLQALEADGYDLAAEDPQTPYVATAEAAQGMTEHRGERVAVRVQPGVDAIVAEDAVEVLGVARRTYDGLFGGGPGHDIVLDIFPTTRRFTAATGLPEDAVAKTNVIALSKWTRLLLTSPRARARGYAWKDTVSHEYIHLVVAFRTRNQAPVWLQEGLAKHLESWWRGDRGGGLSPHHEGLLADAVDNDSFVPFEKFARSMAYLDSSEEAALAFAQVSTMVQFLLHRAGPDALPTVMDRVGAGEEAKAVVADVARFPDFTAFEIGWKAWLKTQPLFAEKLSALPVVAEGATDEFAGDPLLAGRPDLARYARLGDLLRERGRCEAALVEYDKAADPAEPPSPLLVARRAQCHEELGDPAEALRLVQETAALYPEFVLLQTTRGRLLDAAGRRREAVEAWKAAHDINPYDPAVQDALVAGYDAIGDDASARRHLRYARILAGRPAGEDG